MIREEKYDVLLEEAKTVFLARIMRAETQSVRETRVLDIGSSIVKEDRKNV